MIITKKCLLYIRTYHANGPVYGLNEILHDERYEWGCISSYGQGVTNSGV
jgi:hypothetical protein